MIPSPARLYAVLISVAALAACATEPVYAPAERPGGPGYEEQQIETNRFRITYIGRASADLAEIDDLALLRAADVTLAEGRAWFEVVNRRVEADSAAPPTSPRFSFGVGVGSVGRSGGVSVGASTSTGVDARGTPRGVVLEILLGDGEKPDGAYAAAEVADNIRATRLSPAGDAES